MQAIRVHCTDSSTPFSASNPAPPSALQLDLDIPVPQPGKPDEILVRIHAATVTRDELTWPETYGLDYPILGHDFAGSVVSLGSTENTRLKPNDEVYGMAAAENGCTWAEYAIVRRDEVAPKPATLSWAEAASVPMSALTAWQALFDKVGVPALDLTALAASASGDGAMPKLLGQKILVTGASGAVGSYVVQLAVLAGLHVIAGSTSSARNGEFLRSLGAAEVCEYNELQSNSGEYDIIVDTVGGAALESCWSAVKDHGVLVTVDSASFDFVKEHEGRRAAAAKEKVNALFFVVESSDKQLEQIAKLFDLKLLQAFVAKSYPLSEARQAYEATSERTARRGKIILTL